MMKKGMLCLALSVASTLLMAQDILTIQTHTQQKNDTLELKIVFDVAAGMHVYAPSSNNLSQGYIVMKLDIDSIPDGLRLLPGDQWPKPGLAGAGDVYTGKEHTIICRFTGNAKTAPAIIKGLLYFQACNAEMCFPPQEMEFSIQLSEQKKNKKR